MCAAPAPIATLPTVLASGPALNRLVRVELTNGATITGRLVELDPDTLNLKLDAIENTSVRRRYASTTGPSSTVVEAEEPQPVAFRSVRSTVVRGASVRYLDFLAHDRDYLDELEQAAAGIQAATPA